MATMDNVYKSLWWRSRLTIVFGVTEASRGGLGLRLPVAALAALAGLGLLCGSAQAGRFLPTVENPYCPITTYTLRDVAELASSMTDSNGQPVIVVNLQTLRQHPSYGKFLMAHECCHHTLGHVGKFRDGLGGLGPQPFFYIAPALKQMELEADCCAVRMLRDRYEADGIEAARRSMVAFGSHPTGAYYPTGDERAANILVCAAKDE
jgi:hypothetical protein